MPEGGATSPGPTSSLTVSQLRRSRFLGEQYGDITKLREMAARQDQAAARYEQRVSRLNTKIERLRHQATLLREKGQTVLAGVPELEQEIKQYQRDVDAATGRRAGSVLTSDITALTYRIRKLQQKVVDLRQKTRALELHAAQKTQRTSELKVKVDRFLEAATLAGQEATRFRQRADRLQLVAEQDTDPAAAAAPPPTSSPSSTGTDTASPPPP
jgi:peptidoglycan hydrolase CwlO-like protein